MKILYTDSGKNELEEFKKRQVHLLEEIVSKRKYIFGDDVIEITASDVRDAADRIRPIPRIPLRSTMTELIPIVYILLGALMSIGGFAWHYFWDIRWEPQFIFTLMGLVMTIVGLLMHFYIRFRRSRLMELETFRLRQEELRFEYLASKKEANCPVSGPTRMDEGTNKTTQSERGKNESG